MWIVKGLTGRTVKVSGIPLTYFDCLSHAVLLEPMRSLTHSEVRRAFRPLCASQQDSALTRRAVRQRRRV